MNTISIQYPTTWKDYELIDSGNGAKFERFGNYKITRPDPRALWERNLNEWEAAATFEQQDLEGKWLVKTPPPTPWQITYDQLTFNLKSTEFKHIGVFPEQAVNWDWLKNIINNRSLKILNLFAYTGGATMAAAAAGAQVTHVDALKSAITWANENVKSSQLAGKPIRWIEEDAYKFVLREGRRGSTYDGIIMDPPRFGRGSKGEVWKIEEDLPKLLAACKQILVPSPTFFLINAYTADLSSVVLHNMLQTLMNDMSGVFEYGELGLKESSGERILPSGIFARWTK